MLEVTTRNHFLYDFVSISKCCGGIWPLLQNVLQLTEGSVQQDSNQVVVWALTGPLQHEF